MLVSLVALVVVPAALAIRFTDDSYNMPTGVVGQSYSKQFNGAGGCGPALPYQYSLINSALPPGLSMSSSGLISGVPSQAGSWSFWVDLSDQNPPSATWCRPAEAQRQFTIQVIPGGAPAPPPLSIAQSSLSPTATIVGKPYSFQFSAQGGGTQTWSIQSGALPAGIQLSSSGLLSGTPTAAGDFTFKVQVSNGMTAAARAYTLAVVPELQIATPTAPAGEVARPFRLQLAANGGKPQYTWSVAGGTTLPAGLILDPATGVLSGTPAAAGSFPLKLSVTDTLGFTAAVDVKLDVAAKLAIVKKKLAAAKAGRAFTVRLTATGGVVPQAWSIVRGKLPVGIHFAKRTGTFVGTAQRAGRSTIVVQVTDRLGAVSRATFVLKVRG